VTGQVRQLPEAADLTAYRLIQESLTNAAKSDLANPQRGIQPDHAPPADTTQSKAIWQPRWSRITK
jgi:hypothetical protein